MFQVCNIAHLIFNMACTDTCKYGCMNFLSRSAADKKKQFKVVIFKTNLD